jgi:hypothetical protein
MLEAWKYIIVLGQGELCSFLELLVHGPLAALKFPQN